MPEKFDRRGILRGLGVFGAGLGLGIGSGRVDGAAVVEERSASTTVHGQDVIAATDDGGRSPVVDAAARETRSDGTGGQREAKQLTTASSRDGRRPMDASRVLFVTVPAIEGSVDRDALVPIQVGVADTTGPVPVGRGLIDLTVTIGRPDGSSDSFSVTTNDDGRAAVGYDLSMAGRSSGRYRVTVAIANTSDGPRARATFVAGPQIVGTTNRFRNRPALVGETTEVAFLLRESVEPVSGTTVDLTVRNAQDGSTLAGRTTTTDGNGFATISFDPPTAGAYTVEARAQTDAGERTDTLEIPAADAGLEIDFFELDAVRAGRTVSRGGRLITATGPLANTAVTIVYESRDGSARRTVQTSTDAAGFYVTEFDVPTGIDELGVSVRPASGERVRLGDFEGAISVVSPDDDGDTQQVSLDVEPSPDPVSPGGTLSLTATATTADGSTVDGATVDLFLRFGFDGAPAFSRSATTGRDGTTTFDLTVPNDAPDGGTLSGTAALSTQSSVETDSLFIDVASAEIDLDTELSAGDASTVSMRARTIGSDAAASGVPLQFDLQYSGARTGSFGTGALRSGADGTDSQVVQTPTDIGFVVANNYLSPYTSAGTFRIPRPDYPGDLQVSSQTLSGGDSLTVAFETPDGSPASGIVYTAVDRVPVARPIEAGESVTLPLPAVDDTDSSTISVQAAGPDGQLYNAFDGITVEPGGAPGSGGGGGGSDLAPDVTGDGNRATDPDGDGLYEDINGDGAVEPSDVTALFVNLESDAVQTNVEKFDFNGDGRVDFADVQSLFDQLS